MGGAFGRTQDWLPPPLSFACTELTEGFCSISPAYCTHAMGFAFSICVSHLCDRQSPQYLSIASDNSPPARPCRSAQLKQLSISFLNSASPTPPADTMIPPI